MISVVNSSANILGLGDVNGVKALQAAMTALAKKRGDASLDPGGVDGIIGQRTLTALLTTLNLVPIPKLSGATKTVILAALGFGLIPGTATYDIAKRAVDAHASALAPAIAAATAIVDAGGPVLPTQNTGPGGYPIGSMGRYNKTKKVWRIYVPISVGGMAGLGACANSASGATAASVGPCGKLSGLGGLPGIGLNAAAGGVQDASEPPPGTILVGESPALPSGVTNAGVEDLPFWKKWQFWVPLGVGGLVAGAAAWKRK